MWKITKCVIVGTFKNYSCHRHNQIFKWELFGSIRMETWGMKSSSEKTGTKTRCVPFRVTISGWWLFTWNPGQLKQPWSWWEGYLQPETIILKEPSILVILDSLHMPGQGTEYRPPIHLAFISKGPAGGPSHLFVGEYQPFMLSFFVVCLVFFFWQRQEKSFQLFSFEVLVPHLHSWHFLTTWRFVSLRD